ncbi:hypothetical protein GCM10010129_77490 [Streptomyces fumigatiscleroticus]|nr:hypothetical protein GCM10010129_77490 [Streptomyces fumigatiscleroticus]
MSSELIAAVHNRESATGLTALMIAAGQADAPTVRLVEAGASIDAVALTTHAALMGALWYEYPDIAEYLLAQGTALRVCTHYGCSPMRQELMAATAQVDERSPNPSGFHDSHTPLLVARPIRCPPVRWS